MFKPVRTIFMLVFAFVAGIIYDRNSRSDTCLDSGGQLDRGVCYVKEGQ